MFCTERFSLDSGSHESQETLTDDGPLVSCNHRLANHNSKVSLAISVVG